MLVPSRTVLTALRLAEAARLDRLAQLRSELDAVCAEIKARREQKYSPDQPRDPYGRWAPWDHEEGRDLAADSGGAGDAFGVAPDGTTVEGIAGIPDSEKNSTVQSFMSRYCDAGIRAVMPGQFLNEPIERVMELAKSGDPAARRCLKLLGQERFRK